MTSGVTDTPRWGRPSAAGELAWHTLAADQVLRSEGADGQRGLSSAEAAARARRCGPNKLAAGEAEPRWHAFFRQYRDPMQIVLLAAGIGSLYPLKQLGTGILLILLTLFNAVLGLHQEGKAAAAVAALQKMVIIKARVRRDGRLAEIPAERLVPGDVVAIEAGDIVPADGRLLKAARLEVAESALTGESLPVTGAEFGAMSDKEALAKVDGIGVIARVTPQHKVRLVDVLRKQGQIVAMTGDGVNDAPAVKKADIGIAMGITGTEVTKEAAVMILTDDNFSTIVKAVELGRGLYDNLARYIRYQIGGLFGYIITFLSASIFNIAGGEPLLPLQTLWVSFTMLSIQSVGLGYSKPAAGLMDRPPRPPGRPILTRGLIAWLAFAGLLMAIGTLAVISGAEQVHGLAIARTMGMVTFALFLLFFSIESKDQRDSAFSLDTFSDKTFLITTSGSFVLLVLSTVLGIFQTVMKTTRLDVRQWLICAAAALSIAAAAEIRKAVLRRTATT